MHSRLGLGFITQARAALDAAPRLWRWLLLAAVATVLLHGCHGDEDTELFTRLLWNGKDAWFGQELKPLLKLLIGSR